MHIKQFLICSLLSFSITQMPMDAMSASLPSLLTGYKNSIQEFANNHPGKAVILGTVGTICSLITGVKIYKSLRWKYIQSKPGAELLDDANQVLTGAHDGLPKELAYIQMAEKYSSDKDKKKIFKKLKMQVLARFSQARYPVSCCIDFALNHINKIDWQLKILSYKMAHTLEHENPELIPKFSLCIVDLKQLQNQLKQISTVLKNTNEYRFEKQEKLIRDLEFELLTRPSYMSHHHYHYRYY